MKLSFVINFLARSFFVFVIAYLWASFYSRSVVLTFTIAFVATGLVHIAVLALQLRKQKRTLLTRKQRAHHDQTLLQLAFMSPAEQLAFFMRVFESKCPKIVGDSIALPYNFREGHLEVGGTCDLVVFPIFHRAVTQTDVARAVSLAGGAGGKTAVIMSTAFDPAVTKLVQSLDIDVALVDGAEVYATLLQPLDIFPEVRIKPRPHTRQTWRNLAAHALARGQSKRYLFIAAVIFATSFIVRFSLYYIIFATVVLAFAALAHFRPTKTRTNVFGR